MLKPAQYYEKVQDTMVVCRLCPAECSLKAGQKGICKSRFNRDGELVTDNYGEAVTVAIDPIEKKPLYHFYPGSEILSTGPNGCNLGCVHCQNWTISQEKSRTMFVSPEQLVEMASQHDSIGVAFTYTEPIIWYEYIMDCAPLLKEAGLKVVLVSNGYINSEPLEELLKHVDAANIDLKGIRPEFYTRICKGKLQPVLDAICALSAAKVHIEITNLLIPGLNDSDDDIASLVEFVASVSDTIPIHFSAYHPDYKLTTPPTPRSTMLRAREIAQSRLKYVYLGNILIDGASDTICPNCGDLLVKRDRYFTVIEGLTSSKCNACGALTGIVQ